MFDLRQFRSKAKALADLLNYGNVIAPGVLLCKDGMLLAGFYYAGPDISSRTELERTRLSEDINAALRKLGSGWASWIDTVRVPAVGYTAAERSHFPDPISRAIDEERRLQFTQEGAHFESEYAIVLGYLPPLRRKARVVDLIYDEDETTTPVSPASRILAQFQSDVAAVQSSVGNAVRLRRMTYAPFTDAHGVTHPRDELVSYLRFLIDGMLEPVNLPPDGSYLDSAICGQEVYPGNEIKLGQDYIGCVAIEGFPSASIPQILEALDHFPVALRFSTRFLHLDPQEFLGEIKKYRRHWKQKQRGFVSQLIRPHPKPGEVIDQHAVDMVAECDAVTKEINTGLVGGGFYTANVILRDRDRARLLRLADEIGKVIAKLGFAVRIETVNTPEAFLGSLPGHTAQNVRRPPLQTDRLADLLPLTTVWTGADASTNPLYPPNSPPLFHAIAAGATPFRFCLDGHVLGFGPTGSGKTTIEAVIATQALRYRGMRVWSFDYKRGMMATVLACGGRHYDIGSDLGPQLCPFSVLETDSDMAWAVDLAKTCFALQHGRPADPAERDAIYNALLLMRRPGEGRSMTHFHALVQNDAVKDAMLFYTGMGPAGSLLDAEEEAVTYGDLTAFEMEDLLGRGEATVIPTLLTLFRRFEASLTGQPALLDLQEAWVLLLHPVFKAKIFEWLRTMRSKNVTVMLWTQSLAEVMESGMLSVLTESCPNTFYLPNVEAFVRGTDKHPGPYDFYKAKGLNDVQISIIQEATYRRDYYLVTPHGARLFSLGIGPVMKRFTAATAKADIDRISELRRLHGDGWSYAWLDEGGIDYEHLLPEDHPRRPARKRVALREFA